MTAERRLATNRLNQRAKFADMRREGNSMRIAVIGGGVFGTMIAVRLAEFGHSVSLLERLPALMQGTSSLANRLHFGFHYPRDEGNRAPMQARLRSVQTGVRGRRPARDRQRLFHRA
jgi:glycine/D-amino acid oxidase-like deaminating enzyme